MSNIVGTIAGPRFYVVNDTFDRTSALAASVFSDGSRTWDTPTGSVGLPTTNGTRVVGGGGGNGFGGFSLGAGNPDVEIDYANLSSAGRIVGLVACADGSATGDGYYLYLRASNTAFLTRGPGGLGGGTVLNTFSTGTFPTSGRMGMFVAKGVSSATVKVTLNGAHVGTYTDATTPPTGQRVHIAVDNSGVTSLDNLAASYPR